ncbi:MAG: hypothetical protein ACOY4K_00130 [Pseudomonadota bacterium]
MPAFPPTNQRAVTTPGTVYEVDGQAGWIYVCQVANDGTLGFLRIRSATPEAPEFTRDLPLFSRFLVATPSIGRALREGQFRKVGPKALHPDLAFKQATVLWPVATTHVSAFAADGTAFETTVDDPAIQDFEVMAVWDAIHHLPARLVADYGTEPAGWHVGGPMWRERRVHEEYARRFPNQARRQLPVGWIPAEPAPPSNPEKV